MTPRLSCHQQSPTHHTVITTVIFCHALKRGLILYLCRHDCLLQNYGVGTEAGSYSGFSTIAELKSSYLSCKLNSGLLFSFSGDNSLFVLYYLYIKNLHSAVFRINDNTDKV